VVSYANDAIKKVIDENNYSIYDNEHNNLADLFNLIYSKIEVAVVPSYIHDVILRIYNALVDDSMDLVKITINYLLDNFKNIKTSDEIIDRIIKEREKLAEDKNKLNQRYLYDSKQISKFYF
jgi:hypothetical protein